MRKTLLNIYNFIGRLYLKPILALEQKKRPFPQINERAVEYAFSFKHLQTRCTGKVLDIGPGKSSWPHILSTCGFAVTAIDKMDGYWQQYFNRHYKIVNDDITNTRLQGGFQFATCLSVLEHIPDHVAAIKNIHRLLQKNGYLVLTFPYNEHTYHADIYQHPQAGYGQDANFITQVYSRNEINDWLAATSLQIVEQEYYRVFTGEFWTFGERVIPCEQVDKSGPHHLTCLLLQKTGA